MFHQLLAFTLLAGAPPLPPEPGEDSPVTDNAIVEAQTLYQEGTVLFDSADYLGAIEKFTAALAIVKRLGGDDRVRLALLFNIASAHEKQFEIDHDVSHLRQALALYRQYEEFADTQEDLGEALDVHAHVLELEKRLRTYDEIQRNRENISNGTVPPPPTGDTGWKRHRGIGIGLLVTGGGMLVGGVTMIALGTQFEPKARAQVNELADLGVPLDHPAWAEGDKFITQEKRKGALMMGLGGSLAAMGLVGTGVGSFYLVKSKRERAQLTVNPSMGLGFAGVQLTGHF